MPLKIAIYDRNIPSFFFIIYWISRYANFIVLFNLVNNELGTISKEAFVDKFKVFSRQFLALTEISHENLSQGNFFPS
jgi:hypothetical protein